MRFCSPRAARELALVILYAAYLDGSDPIRLFDKRLNERRDETVYEFDKSFLMEYDHMSFGGPLVTTDTVAEAGEILQKDKKESHITLGLLRHHPDKQATHLLAEETEAAKAAKKDEIDRWPFQIYSRSICSAYGRWSVTQPVPTLGVDKTGIEEVDKFYDFWYNYKSWRDFLFLTPRSDHCRIGEVSLVRF